MKKIVKVLLMAGILAMIMDTKIAKPKQTKKKKKAILVISFGTSYNDTKVKTIEAIEHDIRLAYPEYEIREAFTSQIIINKLKTRDNLKIDTVKEALNKLELDKFDTVICQPTHVITGYEYDSIINDINKFKSKFKKLKVGKPLLTSDNDFKKVIKAINKEVSYLKANEALVLMGHGTEHDANSIYAKLDKYFKENGNKNIFVGTLENQPDLNTIITQIKLFNPKKIYLMPLMVVAGDHAINDMAGDDENSWKTIFKNEGFKVELILKGLGEFKSIREIYINHIKDIID